jgi:hypothetical protein
MDETGEGAPIAVRADTEGFARDVAAMKAELESGLGDGAARAGRSIETALTRALRTGRLGFEDLKRTALAAMAEIVSAAIRGGIGAILGGGGIGGLIGTLIGAPGKAIGGPVSPGRPYLVGERGPELFVPTASGRIDGAAGPRAVSVSINVTAPAEAAPRALAASSRQVARAVRRALIQAGE